MTKSKLGYIVVLVGSLFYCYEFFLRVSPSAITDLLMQHFQVKAGLFSAMVAAFFYAYMPMQMFAGLIGDRFGVKRVMLVCIGLCSIATLIFSASNNIWLALVARLIMGLSASFAYVGPLILASKWLQPKYYAASAGFIQVLGSFGAYLVGSEWGANLLQNSWQKTYVGAAVIGAVLMLLVAIFVKDSPNVIQQKQKNVSVKKSLKVLLGCPQTWWIAMLGFAFWAPMSIFGELWGAKFLEQSEGVSIVFAGEQIQWLWIGVALGGPAWGFFSCWNRKLVTKIAYLLSGISSTLFIYFGLTNIMFIDTLLFIFGFSCAAQCLSFGFMRDFQDKSLIGSAVGFTNMCVILGGAVLQPLSGFLIDYFYKNHSFLISMKYTFFMMPLIAVLGLYIIQFKIEETSCGK